MRKITRSGYCEEKMQILFLQNEIESLIFRNEFDSIE